MEGSEAELLRRTDSLQGAVLRLPAGHRPGDPLPSVTPAPSCTGTLPLRNHSRHLPWEHRETGRGCADTEEGGK